MSKFILLWYAVLVEVYEDYKREAIEKAVF